MKDIPLFKHIQENVIENESIHSLVIESKWAPIPDFKN